MRNSVLSALVVLCGTASVASAQLANGGFETLGAGQPDIFTDWEEFNNDAGNIQQSSVAPIEGSFHMEIFGPDNQDGMGTLLQGDTVLNSAPIAASPGQEWTASMDITTPSIDPSTGSLFVVALQFLNSGGDVIQDTNAVRFDNEMTPDLYEPLTVVSSAPGGTTAVRMVLVHVELAESGRGGVMYADNGSLENTADQTLINGSFEVRGSNPLDGWEEFDNDSGCCDNVSAQAEAAESGLFGLKIFGPFNGPERTDNFVFQDVPVTTGEAIQLSVSARNPSFDAIAGTNVGFLEIEFLTLSGSSLWTPTRVATLDALSPFDVWSLEFVNAVAPAGAGIARCKIGYDADDAFSGGAIHYDNAEILNGFTPVETNGGFEGSGGATFDSWNEYGNAIPNIAQAGGFVNDGANACKIFQQFTGVENDSGVFQDLPAGPGDVWTASVFAGTPFDDPIDGDNAGYIALEFVDGNDMLLTSFTAPTADFFTFLDEYLVYSISGTAPAGTASARINIGYAGDAAGSGGSIFYDTASLTRDSVGEPTGGCVADVNTTNTNPGDAGYGEPDGTVDGADLSFYVENWLGGVLAVADVNTTNTNPGDAGYGEADGQVDGADLSYYVEQWLAGDAGAGCP